jgi:peptidoglycan/xylan/chitin deacetylase (PgdA/CDA1 family)
MRGPELILTFHGLGAPPDHVPASERPYWIAPAAFAATLDAIRERAAASPGAPPVRITFDDGNRSDLDLALPALKARGLAATFFACAGRIGLAPYLDAGMLRTLLAEGMAVGSHGMHHVPWRRAGPARLGEEMAEARARLEEACGRPVTSLAAPFGLYDRRALAAARAAGFADFHTSDGGPAAPGRFLRPRTTLRRDSPAGAAALALAQGGGRLARLARDGRMLVKALR